MAKNTSKSTTKRVRKTPRPKKAAFLAAYATCGVISQACLAAGVDRKSHYNWLASDPKYKAAFEEAHTTAIEGLETEARRRATEGVYKLKFDSKGKPLIDPRTRKPYMELSYSDTLLIFLLKGAKPETYRDRVEHTGEGGGPVEHAVAGMVENRVTVQELLGDPQYIEYLRERERYSKPGLICANGHEGNGKSLANGHARNGHRPRTG